MYENKKLKGFTLIESILVITIILFLVGVISLSLGSVVKIGEDKRIENELEILLSASKAYHLAYPDDIVINQDELVTHGFLKEKIASRETYHYKISLEEKKIFVSLEKNGILYQYRTGNYAKVSY